MQKNIQPSNNFDLIRLIAASQVMVTHAIAHAHLVLPGWVGFIRYFPGVPAFFFISGFLISASWERHENVAAFARNRFLRVYPALGAVFAFSLVTVLALYRGLDPLAHLGALLVWAGSQLTLLQAYNPGLLRGYGTGVINGSLWTIPVEICFYIATPIIYWLGRRLRAIDMAIAAVGSLSLVLQYAVTIRYQQTHNTLYEAILMSPLPWIADFCVGMLAQRHIGTLHRLIAGRALYFFAIYAAVSLLTAFVPAYPLLAGKHNSVGIVNLAAMSLFILSLAYSMPGLADRLLRRNDISYGVYIFHMPVLNALMAAGISGLTGFYGTLVLCVALATLSWFLIEKRALALRKRPVYSHSIP